MSAEIQDGFFVQHAALSCRDGKAEVQTSPQWVHIVQRVQHKQILCSRAMLTLLNQMFALP